MIALSDGRIHAIKYTVAHQNRFKAEVTYQLILAKIQMPFNKEIPEKEQADYKGIYVRSRQESSRHQHQMLRSNSLPQCWPGVPTLAFCSSSTCLFSPRVPISKTRRVGVLGGCFPGLVKNQPC